MQTEPTQKTSLEKLLDGARWKPQPKQELILSRPEFELGFGGARGGGKTDGMLAWMGYDCTETRLRGAIIRKNSVDLTDALLRLREIHPRVKIFGNPPIIKFPDKKGEIKRTRDGELVGGATYYTGHLKDKNALNKWVGQNLQRVGVEELNLVPAEEQYISLLASVRSTIPGIKAQVFSTFNPDNVGHSWIKKRFRLSGIPREPIITKDDRSGRLRIFVPSRVEDNEALMQNDPQYVRTLDGLPDGLREQWRYGSWDDPIIRGAFFTVELAQMRREGRITSLPRIPGISVHTFWDIGADTTAIWFVQFVDEWVNIIDFYMNDSLGFPFYLSKLQEFRENRGYSYGIHHFPHDFNKLEWGSGRNRLEIAEGLNLDYEIIPRVKEKQESIDAARLLFPRVRIDQERCSQGLDALLNYRKEWIEEKQTFRDNPVHDWASHPSDAFQGIALSNLDALLPKVKTELGSTKLAKDLGEKRSGISREFGGVDRDMQPKRGRFNYE